MGRKINIFVIYSLTDKDILPDLLRHLSPLVKSFNLAVWHDDPIIPGEPWQPFIESRLDYTDLFLLLVSDAFLNSSFIEQPEFKTIIDRFKANKSAVIPVIIEKCPWDRALKAKGFQFNLNKPEVLPDAGRPIADWDSAEEAYNTIVAGMKSVLTPLAATLKQQESGKGDKRKEAYSQREEQVRIGFTEETETDRSEDQDSGNTEAIATKEEDAGLWEEAEAKRRAEVARRIREEAEASARRREEEERLWEEGLAKRMAEKEKRIREETAKLVDSAAEEQRVREEAEARKQIEQENRRKEDEARKRIDAENRRKEAEARKQIEDENRKKEEVARKRIEDENRRKEEEARKRIEDEDRRKKEASRIGAGDEKRRKEEADAGIKAEKEKKITAAAEAMRVAGEKEKIKMEAASSGTIGEEAAIPEIKHRNIPEAAVKTAHPPETPNIRELPAEANDEVEGFLAGINPKLKKRVLGASLVALLIFLVIWGFSLFSPGPDKPSDPLPDAKPAIDTDSIDSAESKSDSLDKVTAFSQLEVGDTIEGGIIFSIDRVANSGKIAQLKDAGPMPWTEAMKIHEQLGEGWRLPTSDELISMYRTIGQGAANSGQFADELYWSSTAFDDYQARLVRFRDGNTSYHYNKNAAHRQFLVRAVRDFDN